MTSGLTNGTYIYYDTLSPAENETIKVIDAFGAIEANRAIKY